MNAFRLLSVAPVGNELHVAVECETLRTSEELKRDFRLLTAFRSPVVRLDLRGVRSIDGQLMTELLGLHKGLKVKGARLIVEASPALAEVMRTTRFDKMFEVVEDPSETK